MKLAALSLLLLLTGCASTQYLLVDKSNVLKTFYVSGTPYITSVKKDVVTVGAAEKIIQRNVPPMFHVFVANRSDAPFDFDTSNVRARCGGSAVRIYTHDEALAKMKKGVARARAAVALGAGLQQAGATMQANSARQSQVYGNAAVQSSNSYPSGISYSAQVTTYDPAAALAASAAAGARIDAQSRANMSTLEGQHQLALSRIEQMIRRSTIFPGQSIDGRIVLHAEDVKLGETIELVVSTPGEEHTFRFVASATPEAN